MMIKTLFWSARLPSRLKANENNANKMKRQYGHAKMMNYKCKQNDTTIESNAQRDNEKVNEIERNNTTNDG